MYTLTVQYHGKIINLSVEENDNILNVLRNNSIYLTASCGGLGKCKKCKVKYNSDYILTCTTNIKQDMSIEVDTILNGFNAQEANESYEDVGIAIDIGTTTIAFYLVNLIDNQEIDSISVLNNQFVFGADVITRITKCQQGMLKELNSVVISQINDVISYFIEKYKLNNINKIVVSGNPTMIHILVNIDPSSIGIAPYKAVFLESKYLLGKELGIKAEQVIILPSVSAYIGSDIIGGILVCDIYQKSGNSLFIDIGTNGEIVLINDKIYACSTAAGPAFEGSNIECGMPLLDGAIYRVNDDLTFETKSSPPKGICGSGLIDLITYLLDKKIIDENGTFEYKLKDKKFFLTENIFISQKDIREFQLAKSAIISGIKTLLQKANLLASEIDYIYIAGGFGYNLNIKNAIKVGLLYNEFINKIFLVGNTSGIGAKRALVDDNFLALYAKTEINVIDLTSESMFMDYFIENINFRGEL